MLKKFFYIFSLITFIISFQSMTFATASSVCISANSCINVDIPDSWITSNNSISATRLAYSAITGAGLDVSGLSLSGLNTIISTFWDKLVQNGINQIGNPQGTWCGLHVVPSTQDTDINYPDVWINGVNTSTSIPCRGVDPASSCPSGMSQLAFAFIGWNGVKHTASAIYTCIQVASNGNAPEVPQSAWCGLHATPSTQDTDVNYPDVWINGVNTSASIPCGGVDPASSCPVGMKNLTFAFVGWNSVKHTASTISTCVNSSSAVSNSLYSGIWAGLAATPSTQDTDVNYPDVWINGANQANYTFIQGNNPASSCPAGMTQLTFAFVGWNDVKHAATAMSTCVGSNSRVCTNGAANYPLCDQCPSGQTIYGTSCVPSCSLTNVCGQTFTGVLQNGTCNAKDTGNINDSCISSFKVSSNSISPNGSIEFSWTLANPLPANVGRKCGFVDLTTPTPRPIPGLQNLDPNLERTRITNIQSTTRFCLVCQFYNLINQNILGTAQQHQWIRVIRVGEN